MAGSIPANAGETDGPRGCRDGARVYPRERGGDSVEVITATPLLGLSPRTRGRPPVSRTSLRSPGSIPANAGETASPYPFGRAARVYPRERGGDARPAVSMVPRPGLSPRTRGRRFNFDGGIPTNGSIPANAGETPACIPASQSTRVYPRERGGDVGRQLAGAHDDGLSPRTRGRRPRDSERAAGERSIPANAGETLPARQPVACGRVYPRERGGDAHAPPVAVRSQGLSPRTRGRPVPERSWCSCLGSIPANAGETWEWRCTRCSWRVYPRERGGDVL